MNIDQVFSVLSKSSSCNEALQYLYEVNVNRIQEVVDHLQMITGNPEAIANTHPFASLLLELNREEFVAPLIEAISKGVPGESGYLSDYLYALHGLLEGQESLLKVEDHFVHLLGGWLLSTGGGEISWKSGLLLGEIENRSTRE